MAPTIILLLGSAIAIYLSCELFVNAVEWLGEKLGVAQQATGSVLAAFGTALPESVVTLMAVAFGATAASKDLGVGAALGGPLALSTIGYAAVGLTLIATGKTLPQASELGGLFRTLASDQRWFILLSIAKVAVGLWAFAFKPWLGILFLIAYALYVRQEVNDSSGDEEGALEPLTFAKKSASPSMAAVAAQTGVALGVIFIASRIFVTQLNTLGPVLGLPPQLLALLLSPVATELPETMNAIIWVRQGKYRLALANISGAMMIQATVPTALGMFFTPWLLDASLLLGAGITCLAVLILFFAFRAGRVSRELLAAMVLLYVVFVGLLVTIRL
jgi:cation:H+ antiporter